MLPDFHHITPYRIPFADLDMMQHVNHRAYIRWAETTRSEYFVEILGEKINGTRGLILVNVAFTYERQLTFREPVLIGTRVARIGRRSIDFAYEIFSESQQQITTRGRTTMVAYNYLDHESLLVPPEWREKIAAYEHKLPEGLA